MQSKAAANGREANGIFMSASLSFLIARHSVRTSDDWPRDQGTLPGKEQARNAMLDVWRADYCGR